MNKENDQKQLATGFRDNKAVDLLAAVMTGLGLAAWDILPLSRLIPLTDSSNLQKIAVRVGAFVLVTLIVLVWEHPIRARWGWIIIAPLGLIVTLAIEEMILRQSLKEHETEPILQWPGPSFGFLLYIVPTVMLMGIGHYVGILILKWKRKALHVGPNAI